MEECDEQSFIYSEWQNGESPKPDADISPEIPDLYGPPWLSDLLLSPSDDEPQFREHILPNGLPSSEGYFREDEQIYVPIELPSSDDIFSEDGNAPSHENSKIPLGEMASTGPEALTSNQYLDSFQDETGDSDDTSAYSQSNGTSDALGETKYENSAAVLETAKCYLLNHLMQEIWVRFDNDWAKKFITPGGEGLALSCPFRKRDPRKYRFLEYRTCALFYKNVGHIKEHIYRCHRVPIHCIRCSMVFDSEDLLTPHLRDEANRCQVQPEQAFDGITRETEWLLRSRKEYRGQSEPELWRKMYRTLFPNEYEIVPSPYYEAIRDENADSPDVQARANYSRYVRRELLHVIRLRLESAVSLQFQALTSALRTQLDEIIQSCTDNGVLQDNDELYC